jgi:hypothetical protein
MPSGKLFTIQSIIRSELYFYSFHLARLDTSPRLPRGKKSLFAAGLQFALGILALGGMYLTGHSEAEALMLEHKWTGASLAVGLLPFKGLAVVGVLWGITAFIAKNRQQIAYSRH